MGIAGPLAESRFVGAADAVDIMEANDTARNSEENISNGSGKPRWEVHASQAG